ncbi:MAG: transglutaminase-like domain-containing protein, partial [Candidatus Binatia bacterium]
MAGWRALGALGCILLAAPLLVVARAEDEKEIFPSSPESPPVPSEFRPTTTYWKVSLAVELGPSGPDGWFQMALPISNGRQAILSREIAAEGFTTEELAEGSNLVGRWTRTQPSESSVVEVVVLAEVSELRVDPPKAPFPPPKASADMAGYLEPGPYIQSNDRQIRSRAREIVRAAKRLDEAAWALFQYTASFLKTDPQQEKLDALSVLHDQKGSRAGKARLLIAMLRSIGIPARMVGGLRLADASKTRSTVSWVEAHLGDRWV